MRYSSTSKNRKKIGLSPERARGFRKIIYRFYSRNCRDLPWRSTADPYRILVSEVMLQQTQVERVLSKYPEFIRAFPDWDALASAPLAAILDVWKGLGYARRGLALKKIARIVLEKFGGRLPSEYDELISLPSIGNATAGSILAFAFGKPSVVIETNIRAVYIHFFFKDRDRVSDSDIHPYVDQTLDRRNPRKWYYALMDYGVHLKKNDPALLARSAHYRKQSPFRGSMRETRSWILALVSKQPGISRISIRSTIKREPDRIATCLTALEREGFIENDRGKYSIRSGS